MFLRRILGGFFHSPRLDFANWFRGYLRLLLLPFWFQLNLSRFNLAKLCSGADHRRSRDRFEHSRFLFRWPLYEFLLLIKIRHLGNMSQLPFSPWFVLLRRTEQMNEAHSRACLDNFLYERSSFSQPRSAPAVKCSSEFETWLLK